MPTFNSTLPAAKISGSIMDMDDEEASSQHSAAAPQDMNALIAPPQWNESATEHAAALSRATQVDDDDNTNEAANDYPLAMDDLELGDFLMDAMGHINHGATPSVVTPLDEVAACDALHILEDLPHPPMCLP